MSAVSGGAVGEGGVGAGDGAVVSCGGVEGETGGDGDGASDSFSFCMFVVVLKMNTCRLQPGGCLCAPSLTQWSLNAIFLDIAFCGFCVDECVQVTINSK